MTEELYYTTFDTARGRVGLLGSRAGLRRVTLPQPSEAEARTWLGIDHQPAFLSPERFQSLAERLQAYYDGRPVDFSDELDLAAATDFQREVWLVTRRIPYGETTTYSEIARSLGRPKAFRAVGNANAANPIPLVIPCHRVVPVGGKLGGYGGGQSMKRQLLAMERERPPAGQLL